MAEFVSRKRLHKETIEQLNKEIEKINSKDKNDHFLNSLYSQLESIDYKHFSAIKNELNKNFEMQKFYLEKDKSKELINSEIKHTIKKYLNEIESIDNSHLSIRKNKSAHRSPKLIHDQIHKIELKELILKINSINEIENKKFLELNEFLAKENKIIAKSSLETSVLKAYIKDYKDIDTTNLVTDAKKKMTVSIEKINKQKDKYNISYKWFIIIIPIIIFAMISCIVIPFVV
ncbi:hypothetical protein ESOMN_v1c04600 [Williamsoniiplasma somnilux]|uniref:Uncharacterized protein n=1 Tax=Williamsoniiplasma somnilux TaxID=215578 RepID=A0A2K8NYD3_9MOLU|nr:hypothetical protein [Williamsoniiplasma somnilux]ATZ18842.1 hypothetical protein ESOMN_v1c04600 [Williamsoniiplasma somnilux]